jgi:replicative DNA helicase
MPPNINVKDVSQEINMNKLKDIITEKVVLAGLYNHGADLFYELASIVNAETFTDETHQAMFVSLRDLYSIKNLNKLDEPSFFATLNELGYGHLIDNKNELTHLKSIINTFTEKENIQSWCIKLRKLQTARDLIDQEKDVIKKLEKVDGSQSFGEILGLAEEPLINFSQSLDINNRNDIILLHNKIDEYLDYVENNPCDIVGISTGYPIFDESIGSGMRNGTITLMGARTGFGKSLFSINVGTYISSQLKLPVLYLDTEMSVPDHQPRILSLLTYDMDFKVEIREVERGTYVKSEKQKQSIKEATQIFKNSPFFYKNLKGVPFQEHLPVIRKFIYRNVGLKNNGEANPCVIIYDYFKLHDISDLSQNVQERQVLRDMMQKIHDFAGRYNFPVLMLTQLNRDGIDKEDQGVIRGSDSALDPVTTFCIFKEKSADEINVDTPEKGNSKIKILKSRHAEKHNRGSYISFMKIGKYGKITEIKP